MCKVCALAARYSRISQDSLVFNLSQFAVAVEVKASPEKTKERSLFNTQKNSL